MRLDSIRVFPGVAVTTRNTSSGSVAVSYRAQYAIDRFAAELGSHVQAEVRVEEGSELPPPTDGVICVCPPDVLQRTADREGVAIAHLGPRVILIDMVRTYALQRAVQYGLAAVVESNEYFDWKTDGNACSAGSLWGLKDVGDAIGATSFNVPALGDKRYAMLRHPQYRSLPALLAAYLAAYTLQL